MSDTTRERGATYRLYAIVWGLLLLGTAITVTAASLELGRLAILVVLAVASAKSTLVLLYFMHLRWEERLLLKLIVPIVVVVLAIFIGLTFTDVARR